MKILNSIVVAFSISAVLILSGCGDSDDSTGQNNQHDDAHKDNMEMPSSIDLSPDKLVPLTDEQKYALAYMWNEERLAFDIYTNLYKVHQVNQLTNISRSETMHINLVVDLVEAYDINITNLVDYTESYSKEELEAMPSGIFGIQAIQDLYDTLYSTGKVSAQASLEVGCLVEVTDIDDLDRFIDDSVGNQALIDSFNILRDGSYKHYWAFDGGLKKMGIADGCCSLGDTYCKTTAEYPR